MFTRKILAAALSASASLLLAGCLANPSASSNSSLAAKSATPAVAPTSPMAVVGGYPEDLTSYGKTVVVPTAYVKFLAQGKVFVAKQGSALQQMASGGSANSVKASAKYKVIGLDKALAQSIAKQAYDDFVAKLRAAGYNVLTYDDVKGRDYVQGAAREKADATWGIPTESPQGSSDTYLVAAPSDAQQFKIGFTGMFSEFMSRGKPKFEDAAIVIPTYTIVAPQVWGETGSGYNRISAQINTAPGMNLNYAAAPWMGKPKVRMGGSKAPGVFTKGYVTNITPKAGELVKAADTTPTAANALSKGLSLLGGGGSISAQSADYTFTIDKVAYTAGAMKGIGDFNSEVAKFAATAK
jgi:hypothetical protein